MDGKHWTVYRYRGGMPFLKLDQNMRSGAVDVAAILQWYVHKGYIKAGATLGQVDFGWEICSSGGVAETFEMRNYSLTTVLR